MSDLTSHIYKCSGIFYCACDQIKTEYTKNLLRNDYNLQWDVQVIFNQRIKKIADYKHLTLSITVGDDKNYYLIHGFLTTWLLIVEHIIQGKRALYH